jgi:hypothetical protein
MARGPRMSQDVQKDMLFRELRSRGNFHWNAAKHSIQKSGEDGPQEPAPYMTPPVNGEFLIFTKLPAGK